MAKFTENVKYSQETIKTLNKTIENHFSHLCPINPKRMKKTLSSVSRMVMLDRYSQKDLTLKTLSVNDVVIAKIKDDPMFPTSGIGKILSIGKDRVKLLVDVEYWSQIDKSFNHENGEISINKTDISKPLELFFEQIAHRVGYAISNYDANHVADFVNEIADFNFVPAGRILYGAGSGTKTTFFNCFVMPMIQDSRDGIAEHRKEIMEIMSRGGGVGTNGSSLRPKNCEALTVKGKSSGAVSWLNDLSSLTHLIEQGGSRRGAQMIMLNIWHPDIVEFIVSKMQNPSILKHIEENFESELIRDAVKNKLKFTALSEKEREINTFIASHGEKAGMSEAIVKEAKLKLKVGGKYSVNSPEFLSGANISVAITDDFMKAVKEGREFELRFPDVSALSRSQKLLYDELWHKIGDVNEWEKRNYPVKVYNKIDARELWKLINLCATYSAEPGVFFIDIANKATNARSYGQKIVCTNPCGEQPLAPYSVCNLGAVNLSNFVDRKAQKIKWDKLGKTVATAVRFLDNVIDITPYFLEKNRNQALGERRIGLGIMGYHDLLIWMGLRYGSEEANKLTDEIFKFIAVTAYKTSAMNAKEKGNFGFFRNVEDFLKTGYMKTLPQDVHDLIIENNGIRNSHLLTVAPTGSTGTLVGVSTGLEPYFAFKYYRSGRLGKFMEVEQNIVREYRKLHNITEKGLPKHFVSAMELTPKEHVDVQIIIQRWVDSSISKTVNAPKNYAVNQVAKIYEKLYYGGAKGGTVYVDGSRDSQVLSLEKETDKTDKKDFKEIKKETQTAIKGAIEKIDPSLFSNLAAVKEIQEKSANIPSHKSNRAIGTKVGDICPICKEGVIEDLGGCVTCTICGSQLKCGL